MAILCTKLWLMQSKKTIEGSARKAEIIFQSASLWGNISRRRFGTALHLGDQIRREQKIPPYSPRLFSGVNNSTFQPAKAMQTIHQN
ncbi:Pyrethroid hydrolase Ces2a [Trichinella spiralis]|uniref:Pyrethroid hydrolase Ces2a n=1 Tax=Trichinella spiralis TaxID=6334 RepID=A0ABR3KLT3_TRISP